MKENGFRTIEIVLYIQNELWGERIVTHLRKASKNEEENPTAVCVSFFFFRFNPLMFFLEKRYLKRIRKLAVSFDDRYFSGFSLGNIFSVCAERILFRKYRALV